jgi:hypothetical protein
MPFLFEFIQRLPRSISPDSVIGMTGITDRHGLDYADNPPWTKLKVFRLRSILTKQSNLTEHKVA